MLRRTEKDIKTKTIFQCRLNHSLRIYIKKPRAATKAATGITDIQITSLIMEEFVPSNEVFKW